MMHGPHFPNPQHPLLAAARDNDKLANKLGFNGFLSEVGLPEDATLHLAAQRSLRAVLMAAGREQELLEAQVSKEPVHIHLAPWEDELRWRLIPSAIDGIAIGWVARQLSELT